MPETRTNHRVVQAERNWQGNCNICGELWLKGATECHQRHVKGEHYRVSLKPGSQERPVHMVQCVPNGTRCNLCGGQIGSGEEHCSVLRHEPEQFYEANRQNAPSLFP